MRSFSLFLLIIILSFNCCKTNDNNLIESLNNHNNQDQSLFCEILDNIDLENMNNYDRNLLSILKISVKEQAGYSLKSDSLELMNIVSFFEKNNDSFNKMKAIFYTGLIYEEIYSYKIALLCYYEALNTALELNDTYWIAYLHGKIGLMYISEYDHIQSQFHLSESNKYLERINIENFDLGFCIQAAKTIMYKGEPSRSIIYFDNVLQRIKKEDRKSVV